jgi:SAM-dependent methyltransferase
LFSRYRYHDSDPAVDDGAAAIIRLVVITSLMPMEIQRARMLLHAYADRRVWTLLEAKLTDLRAAGATSIRILDAGCGPGTWLRRLVTRAHALGFTNITARGFDIARAQIQRAQMLLPGWISHSMLQILPADLPEADASADLTLCLYSVLSHLAVAGLPKVSSEIELRCARWAALRLFRRFD